MTASPREEQGEPACSEGLLEPLRKLAARYTGVPFLTLGQTVFWDEPLKAVVRRGLDSVAPGAPMALAIHDTDYFARPHATLASTEPYRIVAHNGGSTRDLWCAAGEMSRLFGAETVPTPTALRGAGVRLDVAARAQAEEFHHFVDRSTEAWGWRGIVQTSGIEILTHEVDLPAVLPKVLELLEWGINGSGETLCHCAGTDSADQLLISLRARVMLAASQHQDGSLSDLYQELFPQIHALLLGETPQNIQVTHSIRESRFNPETVGRPRFRILDLFLQPDTRETCARAYNNAVRGSDIYTLDRFGEDTIPFDLVTPEGGRGILRITNEGIYAEGRRTIFIPTQGRIESAEALARAVCNELGPEISLVGKAVAWIAMLAAEFIFVFNEGASSYTRRTRQMLHAIREQGISFEAHPILRVNYSAWDSLEVVDTGFCLPDHYAAAFGKREIAAREFAARWREVMNEQEELFQTLGTLSRPMDLLCFLESRDGARWSSLVQQYQEARSRVRAVNASAPIEDRHRKELREHHYRLGLELDRLQKELGNLRRQMASPLSLEDPELLAADRQELQQQMEQLHADRSRLKESSRTIRELVRGKHTEPAYREARKTLRSIEGRAEMERLRLARNAYLVIHSLENTNRRPTAWWLPLVSPSGAWFRAICGNATAYVEEL